MKFSLILLLIVFTSGSKTGFAKTLPSQAKIPAEFPGGYQALRVFFETHINYPKDYKFDGTKGMALLHLKINEDGSVGDIKLGRPISLFLDSEVIRVAKLLPKFNAAIVDGKAVKSDYKIVIFVKLSVQDSVQATSPISKQAPDINGIYKFAEQQPLFPGGDIAFSQFIQGNLHYPKNVQRDGIEGKVVVRFVVDTDGSVTNPKVVKSLNPDLDAEAIRVVKKLPNFIPGRQQGKSVKVYYNLPIVFSLKNIENK